MPDAGELGPLPGGHHGLSREQILDSQRERLLAAIAHEVATRGYRATTITGAQSAINAPGTTATSATSLTIGTGMQQLTVQTGKTLVAAYALIAAWLRRPGTFGDPHVLAVPARLRVDPPEWQNAGGPSCPAR